MTNKDQVSTRDDVRQLVKDAPDESTAIQRVMDYFDERGSHLGYAAARYWVMRANEELKKIKPCTSH